MAAGEEEKRERERGLMFPEILAILAREGNEPKGALLPLTEGSRGWSLAAFQILSHREEENKMKKRERKNIYVFLQTYGILVAFYSP